MASLGSTVSTRADTAARHMQACRVNYEHLSMMNGKPESEFLNNKFKYCMHKDELAVSLSKPMFAADAMQSSQKYPYPSVITTLGEVEPVVKNFICWSNHISSDPAYDTLISSVKDALVGSEKTKISNLKEYLPVGYSVGLAYAHASSGDNVASVMIGGVVTIPNGHFPMATGDMVQFYWDFEFDMFQEGGARREDGVLENWNAARVPQNPVSDEKSNAAKRQRFQDKRQNGMNKDTRKCNIPLIKPYVRNKGKQVFADNNRVFAKCISCARPFDMVDIMICRQAM
jgi:hypothetical protein